MSLHRLFAIARKEFHHITRDIRTLFLVTIAPAFLLLMLANVFSFDVDHFTLIVLDLDKTDLSQRYVADLTSDGTFRLTAYVQSYADIDAWLQTSQAEAALIIPRGTQAALQANRPAPVQAIIDGVDSIVGSQTLTQLEARTRAFSLQLTPIDLAVVPGAIDVRGLTWFNLALKSLYSMVPGLIAVVLIMPALALALALTREKELGSFESLVATPMRGLEYLFGKTFAYMLFGLASTIPVWLIATLWFHVPFRGSLLTFLALGAGYLLATFGVSMVVANFVKNQQAAMMVMILMFFVPSFFLAGLILPVDTSSVMTRLTSFSLPATHFIAITRGVFLKGLGIEDLLAPASALLAIGFATTTLSIVLFRKRIN